MDTKRPTNISMNKLASSTRTYCAHQMHHQASCLESSVLNDESSNTKRSILRSKNPIHSRESEEILSTSSSNYSSNLSVTFDKVKVREYWLTAGDNPYCSNGGAPTCLNWKYDNETEIALDVYETFRGERRTAHEMRLQADTRHSILKNEFGLSMLVGKKDSMRECKNVKGQICNTTKHALRRSKAEKYISNKLRPVT